MGTGLRGDRSAPRYPDPPHGDGFDRWKFSNCGEPADVDLAAGQLHWFCSTDSQRGRVGRTTELGQKMCDAVIN